MNTMNPVATFADSSMMGCAVSLCADRAEPTFEERAAATRAKQGPRRRTQEAPAMAVDAFTGCLRCGLKGQHQDAGRLHRCSEITGSGSHGQVKSGPRAPGYEPFADFQVSKDFRTA
ncbi:MAG: hypothetical protein JWO19_4493 [Bryobacterales bacterium]|nr:hypothetical protein [Bryobacterales bacterium]